MASKKRPVSADLHLDDVFNESLLQFFPAFFSFKKEWDVK